MLKQVANDADVEMQLAYNDMPIQYNAMSVVAHDEFTQSPTIKK